MKDKLINILNEKAARVNLFLDSAVPERANPQKRVYEAMRYSLLAGGKRIRPVLAITAGNILGVPENDIMPFACAVEMIHTYSLIHDDLPAMDDDDYRRGRYSCHKQFDEATAILAGDALLTLAFEIASDGAMKLSDPLRGLKAIKHISHCAGTEGMIGGQIMDLDAETHSISESELRYLCKCKTGELLRLPALIASDLSGAENTEKSKLILEYSDITGLAFQIKDDILDVEGDISVLGKATGSDEKDGKSTFVTLLGLDKSKKILSELTENALKICDTLSEICKNESESVKNECSFLRELAVFLLERNY